MQRFLPVLEEGGVQYGLGIEERLGALRILESQRIAASECQFVDESINVPSSVAWASTFISRTPNTGSHGSTEGAMATPVGLDGR